MFSKTRRWGLSAIGCGLLLATVVSAQVPQLVPYQGKLLDALGEPVPDGSYSMAFRFYDDCVAGTLLLTDIHPTAQTVNGIYSILLGNGTITPGTESDLVGVFSNHSTVCLGVTIDSDTEMTPRQQIGSVAYAIRSLTADTSTVGVDETDDVTWTGTHTYQQSLNFTNGSSVTWPHLSGSPPPAVNFRATKFLATPVEQLGHPNLESDEQWMICYNCDADSTAREDLSQHAWNQKIEANYFEGTHEQLEVNWNYTSPGGEKFRPLGFHVVVDGTCSHDASYCTDDADCGAGNTCDGANEATWSYSFRPGELAYQIPSNTGRFNVFKGFDGFIDYTGQDVTFNPSAFFVNHLLDFDSAPPNLVGLGMLLVSDYSPPNAGTEISDMFGIRSKLVFSGAADDRSITAKMVALDAWNEISQTGGGSPAAQEVYGIRYKFEPIGNNVLISESDGIRIAIPAKLNLTSPISITEHFGVHVRDQRGFGTTRGAAIIVDAQTRGADADRGNIYMEGGGWNDGHLKLEDAHVWMDKSDNLLRFKDGAPAAQNDGTPLHSPAGTNANWGGMYWGDDTSAAHDTGDEICALAGLSCLETYDMGAATATACGSDIHVTARFQVLCH